MRGNTVYVYFLYLLEIIVMTGKKIINTKTSFEQLQLLNDSLVVIILPN